MLNSKQASIGCLGLSEVCRLQLPVEHKLCILKKSGPGVVDLYMILFKSNQHQVEFTVDPAVTTLPTSKTCKQWSPMSGPTWLHSCILYLSTKSLPVVVSVVWLCIIYFKWYDTYYDTHVHEAIFDMYQQYILSVLDQKNLIFGNFNDQNIRTLIKNVSFEVSCNNNEWYDMYRIALLCR